MTTLVLDHWDPHHSPAWWFLAPLFWIGVWILIIMLVKSFFWRRRRSHHWHRGPDDAYSILAGRYARGEIDEAEYKQRVEVLKRQ